MLILLYTDILKYSPFSDRIFKHFTSPLNAARWAGVCPSLSLTLTWSVYFRSKLRHSWCPPTQTSCIVVLPFDIRDKGSTPDFNWNVKTNVVFYTNQVKVQAHSQNFVKYKNSFKITCAWNITFWKISHAKFQSLHNYCCAFKLYQWN